jgi:hypothetical protein
MKLQKITSALTALALGAMLSTAAHAQQAYNEGDILLGFEQQNGSGGLTTQNYIVDLGGANQFYDAAAGSSLTFNINTTDLTTAFGSGWANNTPAGSLVQWGLVGGSDNNGSTLTLGSKTLQEDTLFLSTGGAVPTTQTDGPQNVINNKIQAFGGIYFAGLSSSGVSGTDAGIGGSADSGGWSKNNPNLAAFGSSFRIEQSTTAGINGPTDSTLSLYQLNNKSDTPGATPIDLGTFSLNSSGVLTFSAPAAVPEPSSFALGSVAFALMVVLIARQRKTGSVS